MAIIWVDGFDSYSSTITAGVANRYTLSGSANTYVTGRNSQGKAIEMGAASAGTAEFSPSALSAMAAGFAMKLSALPGSTQQFFRLRASGTQELGVGVKSDGSIVVGTTDFSGGLLGTSAAGVLGTSYAYIEIEVTRNASTGSVTVYVNGTSVLALTNVNTGSTNYNQVALQGNTSITIDFDDYYVTNSAARLSASSAQLPTVWTLRPSADTATADWTPDSGTNHFDRVNETAWDGDTTYNASTSPTDNDLYDMDNLPSSPASIKAVHYLAISKGVGGASLVGPTLKSGATTVAAVGSGGNTSYTMDHAILETDPNTSAAWTESGVNAAQGGIRCTFNTGSSTRCTGMTFEVLVMLNTVQTETGDAVMTFSGISFTASGTVTHAIGVGVMSFAGISFTASGTASHTGTGVMSFAGISFAATGIVAHVHGTAVMTFNGISISAFGYLPSGPGTGRRQFWTFGA